MYRIEENIAILLLTNSVCTPLNACFLMLGGRNGQTISPRHSPTVEGVVWMHLNHMGDLVGEDLILPQPNRLRTV